MSFLTDEINYNDDQFFEVSPPAVAEVKLSHLNTKSSGLCPTSQNITGQYLVLQQLEAHQKMVSRAKAVVDNSAPASLQSYINVADKQKKKLWQRLSNHSKSSNMNGTYSQKSRSTPKVQETLSEEEDNASLNASSVSKVVQTDIPYVSISSKTADKISWYLEALSQGELLAPPFVHNLDSQNSSRQSNKLKTTLPYKKRTVNGDILETHVNCFIQPKKPFSPRILANSEAKSKIKGTRCYNPPSRRRKHSSTNSSDTFESYDEDEDSDEVEQEEKNIFNNTSEDIETQINKKLPVESSFSLNTRLQDYLLHHTREKFHATYNQPDILKRNEEDKYLDFLSKVTEDILRRGVYSDSAIQQAFEFHMQFYQDDENKDKLQSLLNQVLEGLKITDDESEEGLNRHNPLLTSLSRPNSPPEKETS